MCSFYGDSAQRGCRGVCNGEVDKVEMGKNIVLFVFLSICYFSFAVHALTIQIKPGVKDEPSCRNGSRPCGTLDFVFEGGRGIGSNVVVLIEPGSYLLRNNTWFENKHNISIIGAKLNESNHVISCSRPNIGLSFVRCSNIRIKGLHFENCGRKQDSATEHINQIISSLHFVFSKDIDISSLNITKNIGIGISVIDTGGHVKLELVSVIHSLFNENGSGIVIATTRCGALDTINCTFRHEQQRYIHNSTFELTSVLLSGNRNGGEQETLREELKATPKMNQGGGLTVHLCGNASDNKVYLAWCSFYNNTANWGGAVYIGIANTSQNNKIQGSHSVFHNNSAAYGGGAIQVTFLHTEHQKLRKENYIQFSNGNFSFNSAIWGGAVSIKGSTRILDYGNFDIFNNPIVFRSVKFITNLATVGSAIALATNNMNNNPIGPGVSYSLLLQDCHFMHNQIIQTEDKKVVGYGTVYAEEFMLLINTTTFINNTGTALVLDSSSFTVMGNVTFEQNKGEKGGAVALYGGSWIQLTSGSLLLFSRNSATIKGGAIYFKYSGGQRVGFQTTRLATKDCFFRYKDQGLLNPLTWNCKVIFLDNQAPDAAGNSVYASTLETCRMENEPRMENMALEWPSVFQYHSTFNRSFPEIATETVNITTDPENWNVKPSVPFSPRVELIDEKGHSVYGTIRVNIKSDKSNVNFDPPNNVFLVKDRINDLRVDGKKGTGFYVDLMTTDGQLARTPTVKINMKNCPPGYDQDKEKKKCVCKEKERAITRCDGNFTAFLLAGYWGHINKNGEFKAFKCPKNYCSCSDKEEETYQYECAFNQIICAENRQGDLCGECLPGYSVLLGSERCSKCTNYYLFLLIPIVLVASVFVLVVFFFNFDAFSGYLNAFLYSYQSVNTVIPETVQLDPFIGVVIGTLCLSGTGNTFGICLWDGLTDLQKLGFNLAVPFYILLFTIFIGFCRSRRLFPSSSNNSIHSNSFGRAFSFVYTYCYTALTGKALLLLNPVKINDTWMLYSAPNVRYFGREHIGYGIIAILFLVVFTLGFPALLLFTPYFTKNFKSIAKMEPTFNVLKLCFKNPINSRSGSDFGAFAAFYFLCRLFVLLFDVFIKDETPRLVIIAIASVFFQVTFCWFQPYVIWTMNFWDVLLLTNMCVISIVSVIVSVPYMLSKGYIDALVMLLRILLYLPLAVTLIRLIVYVKSKRDKKRKLTFDIEGTFFILLKQFLCFRFTILSLFLV